MIYIETPRLIVRDWKDTDLEPFRQLNADEEVMRFFPKTLSKRRIRCLLSGHHC
ncbi:RimJ/RimL family protein N-acetyltransferase [Chryseomicrobium aureum]|nr:RimJ/RimL family protein N-acetyltransferase [Chryseomicrobium aureum]